MNQSASFLDSQWGCHAWHCHWSTSIRWGGLRMSLQLSCLMLFPYPCLTSNTQWPAQPRGWIMLLYLWDVRREMSGSTRVIQLDGQEDYSERNTMNNLTMNIRKIEWMACVYLFWPVSKNRLERSTRKLFDGCCHSLALMGLMETPSGWHVTIC